MMRAAGRVPASARRMHDLSNLREEVERAFLVGLDARTRGRTGAKGAVTAQATAARDAATPSGTGPKADGRPSIPEFDAEESLSELRTLA